MVVHKVCTDAIVLAVCGRQRPVQPNPGKCQLSFCKCRHPSNCIPAKPPGQRGPLSCCRGNCVLGPPAGCPRNPAICRRRGGGGGFRPVGGGGPGWLG